METPVFYGNWTVVASLRCKPNPFQTMPTVRRFFWLFLISLLPATLLAQPGTQPTPADSLRFSRMTWQTTETTPGLVWKSARIDSIFNSRQNLNVVAFRQRPRRLIVAFGSAGDSLKPTSWFAKTFGAKAVINGTFFDVRKGGSVDLIKAGGQVLDTTRVAPRKPRSEHQQAALTIRRNRVGIVFGGTGPDWDRKLKAPNVMVTGPLLLLNGNDHPLQKNAFNDNRHPRSCVCLTNDRRVLLLTADGRHANAQGLSLPELASVMRWLGCRDAINLDGGGSTTLWLAGQPDNGVVNYPSDSKQWIHTGERPVSNVLLVK
jgi:exopolysaccharide biosynthesis protein